MLSGSELRSHLVTPKIPDGYEQREATPSLPVEGRAAPHGDEEQVSEMAAEMAAGAAPIGSLALGEMFRAAGSVGGTAVAVGVAAGSAIYAAGSWFAGEFAGAFG